ncbi:DUF3991 domain-containing protein [Halobacillus litoralis]|uniref:DUF3991 domain-containing protein n=1 Tax=Halobacillus litoralis TaxID=45668 RepID=A0A845E7C3_9BACI|nr:DUF3991 domain-containing protein [Halobacillus litoralis]
MRVTSDEINQAKEIPLIDFINANGIDVQQEGNSSEPYYRVMEHDSLVIKGNKFYWNSRSEGGYGSISFAMMYYELSFPEGVNRVNGHEYGSLTNTQSVEKKPFQYPDYYEVNETAAIKDYLTNERGIDGRVVDWCIKKDLLVQDKKENAVFKWKNSSGKIIGADRQGTKHIDSKRGTFKQIMPNSAEDKGFTIDVGRNPDKVALFESPIDMLSYWSIKKEKVQGTRMISMSGLKLKTLVQTMKDMKQGGQPINKIMSCIDRDDAGSEFHDKLKGIFNKSIFEDHRPVHTKDWNDELRHTLTKLQVASKRPYGM